jgi:hypothetical protein
LRKLHPSAPATFVEKSGFDAVWSEETIEGPPVGLPGSVIYQSIANV